MNVWRMENAAGEGRDKGRTGRWREWELGCCGDGGSRGRSAQWEARTREWMGKMERASWDDDDLEADTATMWVGKVDAEEEEDRRGMARDVGRCERGMEVGRWEGAREEIPASILVCAKN
jgi:hypothetical protein